MLFYHFFAVWLSLKHWFFCRHLVFVETYFHQNFSLPHFGPRQLVWSLGVCSVVPFKIQMLEMWWAFLLLLPVRSSTRIVLFLEVYDCDHDCILMLSCLGRSWMQFWSQDWHIGVHQNKEDLTIIAERVKLIELALEVEIFSNANNIGFCHELK